MNEVFKLLGEIAIKGSEKANEQIDKFRDKGKALGSTLTTWGGRLTSFGDGMYKVGKAVTLGATVPLAGLVAMSARTSINFIKLYESTMIVFERMLGGKDAAKQLYGSLLDIAKASTFSQEIFLTASKRLIGFGVSADNTKKYMQAAADAVTAFGGTSEDIDRISYAFGKISNKGKVTMEELNMVMEAGIPATKILANQYGVTQEEIMKMISDGVLPAEEALGKLTEGIENGTDGAAGMTKAMAGMAKSMKGKTLTGVLDSARTSIRSFALSLLGMNPTLKETDEGYAESQKRIAQLTAAISTINKIIPLMAKVLQPVNVAIGNFLDKMIGTKPVFNEVTGEWENLSGTLEKFRSYLEKTDPEVLARLGKVILGLAIAGPILMGVGKGISIIGSASTAIGNAITWLSKLKFETLTTAAAQRILKIAMFGVIGILVLLAAYIGKTGMTADELSSKITGFVENAVGVVSKVAGMIPTIIPVIVKGLITLVQSLAATLPSLIPVIINGAMALLMGIVTAIPQIIPPVIDGLMSLILTLGQMLPTLIPILIDGAILLFMAIATAIPQIIPPLTEALPLIIGAIVNALIAAAPQVLRSTKILFAGLLKAIPPIIVGVVTILKMLPSKAWGALSGILPYLIKLGIQMRSKGISAAREAMNGIIGKLKEIPEKAREAGENIAKGLWNGIKSLKDWVISQVAAMGKSILGGLKKALKLGSPSKETFQFGIWFVQGFVNAVKKVGSLASEVATSVGQSALYALNSELSAPLEMPSVDMAYSISPNSSSDSVNVTQLVLDKLSNISGSTSINSSDIVRLAETIASSVKEQLNGLVMMINNREIGRMIDERIKELGYAR
ncbi:MAG: tape measure protein [Anaerovoracaceae bacterium]